MKSIADKSALIVNACFILAVISVGIAAMVGDSVETRYGIKRLSRGWSSVRAVRVLAPLTGELITIANALTEHRRWWSSLLVTDGHHLSEGNGGGSDLGSPRPGREADA